MQQDLKCFFGLHKYDKPEIIEVKNNYGETTKRIYVSRCTNCGRISKKVVPYESYR